MVKGLEKVKKRNVERKGKEGKKKNDFRAKGRERRNIGIGSNERGKKEGRM